MEYVFTEGTDPYTVKYDDLAGTGPFSIADSDDSFVPTVLNGQRKLVRTSDGTLYAIYHRRTVAAYLILVSESTDEGVTWVNETTLQDFDDAHQNAGFPAIAVDSEDNLHAVWDGHESVVHAVYHQIWYSKYSGGSWSVPIIISLAAGQQSATMSTCAIAVDSADNLHVVYRGEATGYATAEQIWYTKYVVGWSGPIRISTETDMEDYLQTHPSIAIDSNDYVHVTFTGKASGYTTQDQIWYTKYVVGWSNPIVISTYAGMATLLQAYSCIAVDSNDYTHVVWWGYATFFTDFQIWYAEGVPPHAALNWVTPVRISTYDDMEDYIQTNPSIAIGPDDYRHVLWHGKADGYNDFDKIWYALYTDAWATPTVLQPIGQNHYPILRWRRWPT